MIFADKLIRLRKRMGLSQEELADMMKVSRQAVSKWEAAQSIPDLDKVLKLSELFGVSTDYLLKDDIEIEDNVGGESVVNVVTLDEANGYLEHTKKKAFKLAIATLLAILSPVALIVLSILSDDILSHMSEELIVIIGLSVLFLLVTISVILFMVSDFGEHNYKNVLDDDFNLEYGVFGIVKEKRENFRPIFNRLNIIGTILCILCPLPLIITSFLENETIIAFSLGLLFIIVSIAVFMFVYVETKWEGFNKILKDIKKKK